MGSPLLLNKSCGKLVVSFKFSKPYISAINTHQNILAIDQQIKIEIGLTPSPSLPNKIKDKRNFIFRILGMGCGGEGGDGGLANCRELGIQVKYVLGAPLSQKENISNRTA